MTSEGDGASKNNAADILLAANEATSSLLPTKSKLTYEKKYKHFCEWRLQKSVTETDENVLLAFFHEQVNY